MKIYSVAMLAALYATTVTAAPPTTPNFSFEPHDLSKIFDGIGKTLKDYWLKIQCVRDVIAKEIEDSEVKSAWDETKTKVDTLVTVEWQKCLDIKDINEQSKCKAVVVEKGVEAITNFFEKLVAEAKWDLVKEIKEKVVSECFEQPHASFFDMPDEVEDQIEEFDASLPEQFECIVGVIGDVSKANGLEELWTKTEPQLLDRLNKWKQCPSAGNKFLVILCNVREGVGTYILLNEYIRLVAAENPQVIEEFAQEIQARCAGQTCAEFLADFLKDEADKIDIDEKINCIGEAIYDAVRETDYESIWWVYVNDLERTREHIKACRSEPNKWEAAKCVAKEVQRGHNDFKEFLTNLKNASYETYERVKEYIKQRCLA